MYERYLVVWKMLGFGIGKDLHWILALPLSSYSTLGSHLTSVRLSFLTHTMRIIIPEIHVESTEKMKCTLRVVEAGIIISPDMLYPVHLFERETSTK